MYIKFNVQQWVSKSIYCGNCGRKRKGSDDRYYCELFLPWLEVANDGTGRVIKCEECLKALCNAVAGGER